MHWFHAGGLSPFSPRTRNWRWGTRETSLESWMPLMRNRQTGKRHSTMLTFEINLCTVTVRLITKEPQLGIMQGLRMANIPCAYDPANAERARTNRINALASSWCDSLDLQVQNSSASVLGLAISFANVTIEFQNHLRS